MKTPFTSPLSTRFIQTLGCAAIGLLASASFSQAALFTWTDGGDDGDWDNAANWQGGAVPPAGSQVLIDGPYTITRSGALSFTSVTTPATTPAQGFTLTGGATVNNSGYSFRISGSASYENNALIDTGSTLITNRYWVGNNPTTGSNKITTSTIKGTVVAKQDFVGYRPQSATAAEGGYILHIDGGTFTTPLFYFRHSGSLENTNLTAHVLISNGGYLDMGSVHESWNQSSVHYVDFIDSTGTLVFNKTNSWSDLAGVQSLIDEGYIRASGGGNFSIIDNGSSWLVSVPEPSTYALAVGGMLLGLVVLRRRLRG